MYEMKSTIKNMVTVQNFQVVSNKFNILFNLIHLYLVEILHMWKSWIWFVMWSTIFMHL